MNFKEKYNKIVIPEIKKKFGYKNILSLPKVQKIVINVGLGRGLKDEKFNDAVESSLMRITGQKPVKTLAKKAISNFKIRAGLVVGLKVTLRGRRMRDFLTKLVDVTLPRIRDFRGISPKTVDEQGNLNLGFKEHLAFPEIKSDEVEKIHGLQVTIVSSAKNKTEALEFYRLIGFPFRDK